jgi:hypothetical protein
MAGHRAGRIETIRGRLALSTLDEINAAIEAHRAAVQAQQEAANALCGHRPQCLDGALAFFGYLATLEVELTWIAQMAAVCYGNALKAKERRKVVRGPATWWAKAAD